MKNKSFREFYERAMRILDALNELYNDIEWHLCEEQSESLDEYNACQQLQWDIEDTESELSHSLYDTWIEEIYNSEEDNENER